MDVLKFLNALPGPCAQGLIWGIMAIGVYLTFRILDIADLTVDGTMCTGGAVCIMMMLSGCGYLMIVVIKLANETSVPTTLIHIVVLLLIPEFLEIVLLGVT